MKFEVSLDFSQDPASGLYPHPAKSSLYLTKFSMCILILSSHLHWGLPRLFPLGVSDNYSVCMFQFPSACFVACQSHPLTSIALNVFIEEHRLQFRFAKTNEVCVLSISVAANMIPRITPWSSLLFLACVMFIWSSSIASLQIPHLRQFLLPQAGWTVRTIGSKVPK